MSNSILGNLDREDLLELLKGQLSENRFRHVLGVEEMVVSLSEIHGADTISCRTAALYHDFAKNYTIKESLTILERYSFEADPLEQESTNLLHSKVAALLAQHIYGVRDQKTLEAILYHTTAKEEMSKEAKIVFISDTIEKNRDYKGVDLYRMIAKKNLDQALLEILNGQLIYLVKKGMKIHPDTVQARNFLLSKKRS